MKKITIILMMISVTFCSGTLYMSLGLVPEVELEFMDVSVTEDIESGAISVGYFCPVHTDENGKWGASLGGSYDVIPMSDDDVEFGFMALYGSGWYGLSANGMSAWTSLGLSIPTSSDLTDADAKMGMHMGIGISYPINDTMGVSLGYSINQTSADDIDWTFSSLSLSLGYRL